MLIVYLFESNMIVSKSSSFEDPMHFDNLRGGSTKPICELSAVLKIIVPYAIFEGEVHLLYEYNFVNYYFDCKLFLRPNLMLVGETVGICRYESVNIQIQQML